MRMIHGGGTSYLGSLDWVEGDVVMSRMTMKRQIAPARPGVLQNELLSS
jgi:hypothetical protein